MRIQFRITTPSLFVPVSYRKMVLSVIKELIKTASRTQYDHYFSNNTIKPYCFAVYLPRPQLMGHQFKIDEPRLDVTFSTADWGDVALLHNGLLKIQAASGAAITYKNETLKIGAISFRQEPKIETTIAKFRTLSPIVLRRTHHDANAVHADPQTRLFEDGLAIFNQELNHAMAPVIEPFLGRAIPFSFRPIEGKFNETIMRVQDDGEKPGVLFGHKGIFELQAPPELLTLIAQTGLGNRRGYGLGCLEFVG